MCETSAKVIISESETTIFQLNEIDVMFLFYDDNQPFVGDKHVTFIWRQHIHISSARRDDEGGNSI
jgi:hypothetical protein